MIAALFFSIGVKDVIDILLVAFLLYYFYRMMKETGSLNIFMGIIVFIILWLIVSKVLEMKLLGSIFSTLMNVGVLALIILFQDEIRQFFKTLGSHYRFRRLYGIFVQQQEQENANAYAPIVRACVNMGRQKVGALIIIERNIPLDDVAKSGEIINADINQALIENIFFKNSPLHDGAMLVRRNKILAAACILPVSHSLHIPKHLGLRHRAAMGMSEGSDVTAIIVSEETGHISVAEKGEFHLNLNAEGLAAFLAR